MKKLIWIQLALGLFQTGLAVKQEVENNPYFAEGHTVCNGKVRFKRLYNYGMAGGRFAGHTKGIVRCSGICFIGCVAAFLRLLWEKGHTVSKLGFAFLTGGALSNLYERCTKGYVVDYVSFRLPIKRLERLVFNLADFFILAGAALICLGQAGCTKE